MCVCKYTILPTHAKVSYLKLWKHLQNPSQVYKFSHWKLPVHTSVPPFISTKFQKHPVSCTTTMPGENTMLWHAFYVLPLLHPCMDGSSSVRKRALQKRVPQSLPSSTSLFSAAVPLRVNKSDINVAKQNQAGQMKVNLMVCKLGFSAWQTESELICLWQPQWKD